MRLTVAILLLTALAGWIGYQAVRALRYGVANAPGVGYPRTKRPVLFWLTVAVQLGFTLVCIYALYRQFRV